MAGNQLNLFDVGAAPQRAGNMVAASGQPEDRRDEPTGSLPDPAWATRVYRDDPASSAEAAAESIKFREGHYRRILQALLSGPQTAHEISQAMAGELDNVQINRRLSEMAVAGLVRRLEGRTCRVTGRSAAPVMLTGKGHFVGHS